MDALIAQVSVGLQADAVADAMADGRRQLEAKRFAEAIAAFQKAGEQGADAQAVTAAVAEVRARMRAAGEEALKTARTFHSQNRIKDAIPWYEAAVRWLPADDPRQVFAREQLAALAARQ